MAICCSLYEIMNSNGEFAYHEYSPKKGVYSERLKDVLGKAYVFDTTIDQQTLNDTIQGSPALVIFFANWCGHCHALESPLRELMNTITSVWMLSFQSTHQYR